MRIDTGDASWEEWATSAWGCQGSPPPHQRRWLEEGGAVCLFQPPASPYRPGWTGGLDLLSVVHILGKLSRQFCLQFSWNEAEFELSLLCVCVCVSHPSVTTGLICATAVWQGSVRLEHTALFVRVRLVLM